jgi:crossover junction endodeoxyribonuclease RuvC
MLIFGIDPGSRITGYGVIKVQGNRYQCVDYGAIRAKTRNTDFPKRLCSIYSRLSSLMEDHQPEAVAIEEVFHAVNTKTALILGQVRGVALLSAAQHGIPIFEYSPLKVKKSVVGYGRAEKHQIQMMVKRLLNMEVEPEPDDAADALAIALCHAFNKPPVQHSPQR